MPRRVLSLLAVLALLAVALRSDRAVPSTCATPPPTGPGGCGSQPSTPIPTPTAHRTLKVGLGYIPSVQFAPFYYARAAGLLHRGRAST